MSPDSRSKRRPCGLGVAAERIELAAQRLAYAEDALTAGSFNVAAELAVTAGVNLSDAICCLALGEHVQGAAHDHALELLESVDREAAKALGRLLSLKTRATYGGPIGGQPARKAIRSARRMMALAQARLDATA